VLLAACSVYAKPVFFNDIAAPAAKVRNDVVKKVLGK
jgi:hypothetical protein